MSTRLYSPTVAALTLLVGAAFALPAQACTGDNCPPAAPPTVDSKPRPPEIELGAAGFAPGAPAAEAPAARPPENELGTANVRDEKPRFLYGKTN